MDTFIMDRMGAVHVWQGKVDPQRDGKYTYTPGCDLYLQFEADTEYILESLQDEDREDLLAGWTVYAEVYIDFPEVSE